MDFRQLRHFLVVAEELHFGRAAQRLGIAQPPLSQSIKRLEADLGFDLFDRSSRRVELSAAGRAFLPDVRSALMQLSGGAQQALRVARGDSAELDVGFVSIALFQALPTLMHRARQAMPSVHIKLIEQSSVEQIESLRAGKIDLALVIPTPRMLDGLESLLIERSRNVAAIPEGWPLADRPEIRLMDLADLPFVLPPLGHGSHSIAPLIAACEAAGFTPRVQQEAFQAFTMLSLVGSGFGVSIVPETAARTGMKGVRFVPITDLPSHLCMELVAAWLPGGESPALTAVVDAMRQAPLAAI